MLDQRTEVPHVRRRADERERDEVHAELEHELEVVHVLAGQRRNGDRDAGQVHAFVGRDDAADEHGGACAAVLDRIYAETDEAVVDQDLVPRLQDLADHRRADRELTVGSGLGGGDDDLLVAHERDRLVEVADA